MLDLRFTQTINNPMDSSINQRFNKAMPFMLSAGATFVKKNYLVARIVSFDSAGLHRLTFCILEPYSSKDIELDLSHVIIH